MKKLLMVCVLLITFSPCLAGVDKESDPRLHSGGGIWGFRQSDSQEERTFRVLLIGDSVMNGYQPTVIQALKDSAHVDIWLTPAHLNSKGLRDKLARIVSGDTYDVIHFNIGLHGWPPNRIPKGKYESLLRQYVEVLRQNAGAAKLIWASTTPMMTKETPRQVDPVNNLTITKRNAIAEKIMLENGITINDLYSTMSEQLDLGTDQFHWNAKGKQIQAEAVIRLLKETFTGLKAKLGSNELYVYKQVESTNLYLDVYRPVSKTKTPVLIMVHGGDWSGGQRNGSWERPLAEHLPKEGIALVSIDYRLMRGEASDITTGTFDRAMEDISAAYEWICKNADSLCFDVNKIGICGSSAGGHLSAIFAQRCSDIRYYVGICGLYDMCDVGDSVFPEKEKQIRYGLITEEDRRRASALYNIRQKPPITLLMHGTEDTAIDCDQAVRFGQALKEKNGTVQVELFDGLGHGFIIESQSTDRNAVTVMIEFLKTAMFDKKK